MAGCHGQNICSFSDDLLSCGKSVSLIRVIFVTVLLVSASFRAGAEEFTNAIHSFLQRCLETERVNSGIVIGMVNQQGRSIISCGKLDNGTDQEVNGDTVFEIGSITKTFTTLLLQDMVGRGEMKLEDPVTKYLPASVKMPVRNGKDISLLHLATHMSGLPREPDNYEFGVPDNPCAGYTVEKLYAFLSGYNLSRDPGVQFEYSNPGIAVLARTIALKAGTDYEPLLVDRICRPLKMDSTRLTLTPDLKARSALGHSALGSTVPSSDFGALAPVGGLHSTANDMLNYLSAGLGLTPSGVGATLQKAQEVRVRDFMPDADMGLAWVTSHNPEGTRLTWHNGATYGFLAYAGMDKAQRRGVVVLSSARGLNDLFDAGKFLLTCEWQSERRPKAAASHSEFYDAYAGQYQRSPDLSPGLLKVWRFLRGTHKATIYAPAVFCLIVLGFLAWQAGSSRKRWVFAIGGALATGLFAALLFIASRQPAGELSGQRIGIRREGEHLFAQVLGSRSWPLGVLLCPFTAELLPESESRFFDRLSGAPIAFSRNARGRATTLTAYWHGRAFSFERISDDPPKPPDSPEHPVAIQIDPKLLDACVGQYECGPGPVFTAGIKVTISRDGDRLVLHEEGVNAAPGAIGLYPESETNFFTKIDSARLVFIKNETGEVTGLKFRARGLPDYEGKRIQSKP
jgi:D-alanyl-D-alanine-carboxypeptidase/D-alanyl-D-alanine-endopeptidase